MLLREVRRGFSEESQFHFQVADTTLQFLYPFRFRHSGWKRIPCYSLPVCFNPEPESGIIDTELAGDLGDRQGVIDHLLGGLFLKFRTVPFRFPRHFPVPFRVRSYWIPVRKPGGTSDRQDGKRAALSEARKILRQACHILAEVGDDALSAA